MQNRLDWYIKDQILIQRWIGNLSIEQLQHENHGINALLDASTAPIHLIIDARYITAIPTDLLQLSYATTFIKHPALGWFISISSAPMLSFLARLVPQIAGFQRSRVFPNLDLGLAFLQNQEPSLNWMSADQTIETF